MLSNPVLRKEIMRMRLRQAKPARIAIVIGVFLGVLFLYWNSIGYLLRTGEWGNASDMFAMTIVLQFLVIGLIAPSTTANSISQEREQQTWEMLLHTRLTPREILFGKLAARMLPILAIILLGLPITLFCTLVSPASASGTVRAIPFPLFLVANAAMLITGLFFATFGLYMSMRLKRTLYALIATYAFVVGGLCIGTMLITETFQMFTVYNAHFIEQFPLMWINPVYIITEICSSLSPHQADYLPGALLGLVAYAGTTLFLLLRMTHRFRRFAYDS